MVGMACRFSETSGTPFSSAFASACIFSTANLGCKTAHVDMRTRTAHLPRPQPLHHTHLDARHDLGDEREGADAGKLQLRVQIHCEEDVCGTIDFEKATVLPRSPLPFSSRM